MNEDINIYEIMLELAEEENEDLKVQNDILAGYAAFLEEQNKDLIKKFNSLFDIKKRKN